MYHSRSMWKLADGVSEVVANEIVEGCLTNLQYNNNERWTPEGYDSQSPTDNVIHFLCQLMDHNGSQLNSMKIREATSNLEDEDKRLLTEVLHLSYSKLSEKLSR